MKTGYKSEYVSAHVIDASSSDGRLHDNFWFNENALLA